MFVTEANEVTVSEGDSVSGWFPSWGQNLVCLTSQSVFSDFASKTNDLGAIECQNISFTSQESLPSKSQYPEC